MLYIRLVGYARQLLDGRRLVVHELEMGLHALLRRVPTQTLLPAARTLPARRRAARCAAAASVRAERPGESLSQVTAISQSQMFIYKSCASNFSNFLNSFHIQNRALPHMVHLIGCLLYF